MLATLLLPRLTSRGVLTGFFSGLASGVLTLSFKAWIMSLTANPSMALDYKLEGISIFINIAVTCAGMYAGSRWLSISADEQSRTAAFFLRLDKPISATEAHVSEAQEKSTSRILRLSTAAVGALLLIAGALAKSSEARWVDGVLGALLLLAALPGVSYLRLRLRNTNLT
jgi:hypothetical protein